MPRNLNTTSELYGGLSLDAKRAVQLHLVEFVKTSAAQAQLERERPAAMRSASYAVQGRKICP